MLRSSTSQLVFLQPVMINKLERDPVLSPAQAPGSLEELLPKETLVKDFEKARDMSLEHADFIGEIYGRVQLGLQLECNHGNKLSKVAG